MDHYWVCKTCSTRQTVAVHPNGYPCQVELASELYDLIEKLEKNPNTGPGVKDEWVAHTVENYSIKDMEMRKAHTIKRLHLKGLI